MSSRNCSICYGLVDDKIYLLSPIQTATQNSDSSVIQIDSKLNKNEDPVNNKINLDANDSNVNLEDTEQKIDSKVNICNMEEHQMSITMEKYDSTNDVYSCSLTGIQWLISTYF